MQFMPATWHSYGLGGDVHDPHDSIMGAANYLAQMGATLAPSSSHSTPDGLSRNPRLDRALLRYNHDEDYVRAVRNYAAMMDDDPTQYLNLYSWPVEISTMIGTIVLPAGYSQARRVSVSWWVITHNPDSLNVS